MFLYGGILYTELHLKLMFVENPSPYFKLQKLIEIVSTWQFCSTSKFLQTWCFQRSSRAARVSHKCNQIIKPIPFTRPLEWKVVQKKPSCASRTLARLMREANSLSSVADGLFPQCTWVFRETPSIGVVSCSRLSVSLEIKNWELSNEKRETKGRATMGTRSMVPKRKRGAPAN